MPSPAVVAYLERFRDAIDLRAARDTRVRHPLPEIQDVTIEARGLADQSLREARMRERFGVNVVSITRTDGAVIIDPDAETLLRPGDQVRVFGLAAHIAAFRLAAAGALPPRPRRAWAPPPVLDRRDVNLRFRRR